MVTINNEVLDRHPGPDHGRILVAHSGFLNGVSSDVIKNLIMVSSPINVSSCDQMFSAVETENICARTCYRFLRNMMESDVTHYSTASTLGIRVRSKW